jgi:hypothetical protein
MNRLTTARLRGNWAAVVAGGGRPAFTPRLRWPYQSVSTEVVRLIGARARAFPSEFFAT